MKKLFLLLLLCSCSTYRVIHPKYPVIVQDKAIFTNDLKVSEYRMIDSNGVKFIDYDDAGLWNIGDTIRNK